MSDAENPTTAARPAQRCRDGRREGRLPSGPPHDTGRPISRRALVLAAAGFSLAACTQRNTTFNQSIRWILADKVNEAPVPRTRIASIPYATITAKVGDGPRVEMFLTRVNGESLYWSAGRTAVFVTRGGRLVKTAGLPANLVKTRYLGEDFLTGIVDHEYLRDGGTFRRLVDVTPPDRYGVMVTSTFEYRGPERIEISELTFDTDLLVERCEAAEVDWRFENRYWIGWQDAVVWQSIQHVHPIVPSIRLQVLKPPAV